MRYAIGQRVVCIVDPLYWEGETTRRHPGIVLPQRNTVYRVRGYFPGHLHRHLYLVEIVNVVHKHRPDSREPAFDHNGFRPVTDISTLTALLDTTKISEPV